MATEDVTDQTNPFASEEELAKIAQLKEKFAAEFEKRKGDEYLAHFGDIKLTRILRGNGGEVEASITWFERYINIWNEHELDTKYLPRIPDVTKDDGMAPIKQKEYKGCEKVLKFYGGVFNGKRHTPAGDVVAYLPFSEYDPKKIWDEKLTDEWKDYQILELLCRDRQLDFLSRKQNRITKLILFTDWTGVTMSHLMHSEMMDFDKKVMNEIREGLPAEIVHMSLVVGIPRWAQRIWDYLILPFLPERFAKRIRILGPDWKKDKDMLTLIGSEQVGEFVATRKMGTDMDGEGDKNSGMVTISAGSCMERVYIVEEGQSYSWEFEVQPGGMLLSPPEIDFSVTMVFDKTEEEFIRDMEEKPDEYVPNETEAVVEKTVYAYGAGKIQGTYEVKKKGMLVISWSNEESVMRAKAIQFKVTVPPEPTDADGDAPSGGYPA